MLIGIVGWVMLGLLTGFIVSKFINLRGDDPNLGILMGGAGGFVGGLLYTLISGTEVTGFNPVTLAVAALGAGVVVGGWHGWRRYNAA